ncbi:hypothetical protein QJS10_CPA16g01337 [Acorus calamus]|uniref:Uncharacterized protein n=1 Tax=Acorus calamus TaxID=4465 RepID=A0AAV9D514_ACOCL|nr:hypothetical protein QJS10_CPA16g01337 [Acorus calamus]
MTCVMSKSSSSRPCGGFVLRSSSSSSSSTNRGSSSVRFPSHVCFESLKSSLNGEFQGTKLVIGDGSVRPMKLDRKASPVQIKKMREALAKHTTDRCSLGPARGLEESELLALSSNKDLSFTYTTTKKPLPVLAHDDKAEATTPSSSKAPFFKESPDEEKTLVSAGR